MTDKTVQQTDLRVWDLPLRLFHWGLVAALSWSWISIEILEDLQQHFYAGYTVVGLIIFRISWGFFGTFYSRFRRLWFGPHAVLHYVRSMANGPAQRFAGHNPLGSLAVIAMLLFLITQVSTGLFSGDDYSYGPLAGWVEPATVTQLTKLHKLNFEVLQILILLHICAILAYRFFKGEHLIAAMFTGRKRASAVNQVAKNIDNNRRWLALGLILISAVITYVLVVVLAEPVPLNNSFY